MFDNAVSVLCYLKQARNRKKERKENGTWKGIKVSFSIVLPSLSVSIFSEKSDLTYPIFMDFNGQRTVCINLSN